MRCAPPKTAGGLYCARSAVPSSPLRSALPPALVFSHFALAAKIAALSPVRQEQEAACAIPKPLCRPWPTSVCPLTAPPPAQIIIRREAEVLIYFSILFAAVVSGVQVRPWPYSCSPHGDSLLQL